MKKLMVDIGNSRTKWAVFDAREAIASGAINNNQTLDPKSLSQYRLDSAWVCSVAADAQYQKVARLLEEEFALDVHRVAVSREAAGLFNSYLALESLGVDRWVAAIGARASMSEGALIVIDAGTAVTVDCVSVHNRFEGGVILPGRKMMHDALVGQTAGIHSSQVPVSEVVGRSTEHGVNAGALFGLVGAIERVVEEIQQWLSQGEPTTARVLMCGGDAPVLRELLPDHYVYRPGLIFEGLQVISECSD